MQTLIRSWHRNFLEAHWWRATHEATWKARMRFCSSTTRCSLDDLTPEVLECYTQTSSTRL